MIVSLLSTRSRSIEWLVEVAFAAMLPAMTAEPIVIGGKMIVRGLAARWASLVEAGPSRPAIARLAL